MAKLTPGQLRGILCGAGDGAEDSKIVLTPGADGSIDMDAYQRISEEYRNRQSPSAVRSRALAALDREVWRLQ